jgi:hypothetical protein
MTWGEIRFSDRTLHAHENCRGGGHRWHMGGFDEAVRGGSFAIGHAYARYPLAVKLHIADLQASYLIEAAAAEKSL